MSKPTESQIANWLRLPTKIRWKLFRQFQTIQQLQQNATAPFNQCSRESEYFAWSITRIDKGDFSSKLLLVNQRGLQCEAVALMPPKLAKAGRTPRATACISSQPGCGVGCPFCATGTLGYRGDLTAAEIVEQVYWTGAQARLAGRGLRNVVFMGMGEPLHNADNVFQAIEWLTKAELFGFPQRRIIVSTVGVPQAMIRLAEQSPGVRQALSLHSAEPLQRRTLVPRAVADLDLLRETIIQVNQLQSESLWIEVVMLSGVNDSLEHADRLVEFCRGLRVEVNLIPYNANDSTEVFKPSDRAVREQFASRLRIAGIRTTIRTSLGKNSQAACGQLRASN